MASDMVRLLRNSFPDLEPKNRGQAKAALVMEFLTGSGCDINRCMTRRSAMMFTAVSPLLARAALAQDQKQRASPHDTASADLNGKEVSISYGRPYLKGRQVGDQVAPYGKVWRLGADEATKITVAA